MENQAKEGASGSSGSARTRGLTLCDFPQRVMVFAQKKRATLAASLSALKSPRSALWSLLSVALSSTAFKSNFYDTIDPYICQCTISAVPGFLNELKFHEQSQLETILSR